MEFEKKHLAIVLVVVGLLYVRYKRKGYIFKPNELKKAESDVKSDLTKYDLGECDFRSNGISVFNIDYQKMTFNYMAVADNESVQGLFEMSNNSGEMRLPNNQGGFSSSTGWKFEYGVKNTSGLAVVELTLSNTKKKSVFTKIVDFTNKRIG